VVLENPNSAGMSDLYELYDRVCDVALPPVSLRGHASTSLSICGGFDKPGSVRVRYSGEERWLDMTGLHGWSVIEAPRRPMGMPRRPSKTDED
jgi:hypothetical protein